jgi:hypothetical protein
VEIPLYSILKTIERKNLVISKEKLSLSENEIKKFDKRK